MASSPLGIYKSGQGYWVRALTAAMIAIATFATAAWLWGEMDVVATRLPYGAWNGRVGNGAQGALQPGQTVVLLGERQGGGEEPRIGTAVVETYNSGAQFLTVTDFQAAAPGLDPSLARAVVSDETGGFSARLGEAGLLGQPIIDPFLLKGLVAAAVLLIGALVAFWLTARKASSVDFLISTDSEMKKVNWSTRKDITRSTVVVIGASVLIAGALFLVDLAFQGFFRAIGVLSV